MPLFFFQMIQFYILTITPNNRQNNTRSHTIQLNETVTNTYIHSRKHIAPQEVNTNNNLYIYTQKKPKYPMSVRRVKRERQSAFNIFLYL